MLVQRAFEARTPGGWSGGIEISGKNSSDWAWLWSALESGRLFFAYEPVTGVDGVVDYYECLLRMADEGNRVISVGGFVPALERSGDIGRLDRYVLGRTLETVGATVRLGCNISALSVGDAAWTRSALAMLRARSELTRQVVIEITETAAIPDMEVAKYFVREAQALGCRVALDDFGAGHASLSQLWSMGADIVKIDRMFLSASSSAGLTNIGHIAGLAASTGAQVVVEGVETEDQFLGVQFAGVTHLQGYYFGRPSFVPPLGCLAS
jgi:EAL domain-containing protein (putative c-di-GMP-specific phosphodiesterase class I)